MDSFFGRVALFLQLHNASSNSYLSDHPQWSSGVVLVKGIKQLLPEFVLLIQAGNVFSVQIYAYIGTHMHVLDIPMCVYTYLHTVSICHKTLLALFLFTLLVAFVYIAAIYLDIIGREYCIIRKVQREGI